MDYFHIWYKWSPSIRCVACDDLWTWPISSRSFDIDLENGVLAVASTVQHGFFLYLAQLITIISGYVACCVFFRSWKFDFLANFLFIFGLGLEKNLQFSMDSFHIQRKCSLVWEGVLHIMTFDLDLYLQGHMALALKIMSALWHLHFLMDSFRICYGWSLAWEGVSHVMTFDLDLYLQGNSTLTQKIVSAL